MTAPFGNAGPDRDLYEQRYRDLEARVAAVEQRSLRNAGEISILGPGGVTTFVSGPSPSAPPVSGAPQWVTQIRDQAGAVRLELIDLDPITDGFQQAMWIRDHTTRPVITTDINGGLAEPWLPVLMYPRFSEPSGLYSYRARPTDVTERTLWEGRIGFLSHPRIQVDGVWGAASGTNTTRYRMKIGGVTVGTWDQAGLSISVAGPFTTTLGAPLRSTNVGIEITAQTLSGSGDYACQVWACYQRQT